MNNAAAPLTACLLAAALLAAGAARAESPPPSPEREARAAPADNYCVGGIEDRKIIVHESRLTEPFRQTTRLGCEVDGGEPETMPDLPAPSPEHRVLA